MVVLREIISHSCEDSDVGSTAIDGDADSSLSNDFQARAFRSQQLRKSKSDVSYLLSPQGANKDWRTSAMLMTTLFRIETWLHARVLESVWWQVYSHDGPSLLLTRLYSTQGSGVPYSTNASE